MKHNYPLPSVSIVIPAFNEAALIEYCLKSIRDQDYLGKIELIVVDNASTDQTVKIAQKYNAKIIYEATRGVVYARIRGFNQASSEIIISTDADTIVPKNWVSQIVRELSDSEYDGLVGAYSIYNTNTIAKKIVKLLIPLFRQIDRLLGAHFAGANFAVKKSAYKAVDGFQVGFETGEDLDLSYRLRKSGFNLKVNYKIKVKTSARRLNEGFWNTFINYIVRNWFSLVFFHHPYLRSLTVVREEASEIKDISIA